MHIRMGGHRGGQKAFWELVCMGPGDAGSNWGVARTDGTSGQDGRRALGGYSGPLDSRSNDGLHEGAHLPIPGFEAQGPRVSDGEVYDDHALLRRRKTQLTEPQTH